MPPQAKGEITKLSTRYWAVLCRNAPPGPRSPGHDGAGEGGRRRARRGRDGRAEGVAGGCERCRGGTQRGWVNALIRLENPCRYHVGITSVLRRWGSEREIKMNGTRRGRRKARPPGDAGRDGPRGNGGPSVTDGLAGFPCLP